MQRLIELLTSGAIFAPILALLCLEAAVLIAVTARTRVPKGIRLDLLVALLAGAALLSAAILVLSKGAWYWIALALTAALVAHTLDLTRRLARAHPIAGRM